MAQEHIETRTPEEMHKAIFDRLMARGRAFSAGYDHNYLFGTLYKFPFDVNSFYKYGGWKERDEYPDKRMIVFRRESDNKMLTMTIFSKPPEKIHDAL